MRTTLPMMVLLAALVSLGCGSRKGIEMPSNTVAAPKSGDVSGVGVGSGKGPGLPAPPELPPGK